MTQRTLAQAIAETVAAMRRCEDRGNAEQARYHRVTLRAIERELPSGAGVDNGTTIEIDRCTDTKIVLACSFHYMDENGFYDGWTIHTVKVTPTFNGIAVCVDGENRNNIREYLADLYCEALSEVTEL